MIDLTMNPMLHIRRWGHLWTSLKQASMVPMKLVHGTIVAKRIDGRKDAH
jgi:hypothetical protein